MKIESRISKATPWLFGAVAVWHAAIAITATTALIWGGWDDETFDLAWRQLFWAVTWAYVSFLIYDNRRLRSTPTWRAAADSFSQGYSRGVRDAQRIAASRPTTTATGGDGRG